MKKNSSKIIAMSLMFSILISYVGIDIHRHVCSHTGNTFVSLYSNASCNHNHGDVECACSVHHNIKNDDKSENSCCSANPCSDIPYKHNESEHHPVIESPCCRNYTISISLTETFLVQSASQVIPDIDAILQIIYIPFLNNEIDSYKNFTKVFSLIIKPPILEIIKFIHNSSNSSRSDDFICC